jgi:hypothetical protein
VCDCVRTTVRPTPHQRGELNDMWRLTGICKRTTGTTPVRPWTCQVMAVSEECDRLLIDLVPLEPGSISPGVSTVLPFTVRVSRDLGTSVVAAWAADADMISVQAARRGPTEQLILSAGDHQLVFELPADRPCAR